MNWRAGRGNTNAGVMGLVMLGCLVLLGSAQAFEKLPWQALLAMLPIALGTGLACKVIPKLTPFFVVLAGALLIAVGAPFMLTVALLLMTLLFTFLRGGRFGQRAE